MKISVVNINADNIGSSTESILNQICEWERLSYGDGLHRIPSVLNDCILKSSRGFLCAFQGSEFVGYTDIWELHVDFYSLLRVGLKQEEELASKYILGTEDKKSGCWYIGSIITSPSIRDRKDNSSSVVFQSLSAKIAPILATSTLPAKCLSVGSTPFGSKILRSLGFQPIKTDIAAIDLRPRFEKVLLSCSDADSFYLSKR